MRDRYDIYGAMIGVGLPLVGTAIEALRRFGSLAPAALLEAHLGQPLLWIMDTAPFVLGALGMVIARQHRAIVQQSEAIVRLERARRESFGRTASELFHAAKGLLGNVSAFTSTTTETAASVRETTTSMNQLSQAAAAAALTAENVIGLALQAERASQEGLEHAEASRSELLELAEEVRVLSHRIEALDAQTRDALEIAAVVTGVADGSERLAGEVDRAADGAGPAGAPLARLSAEVRHHAEETRRAAGQVKEFLAGLREAMLAATRTAAAVGRRAGAGAKVADETHETIGGLAAALRESARAAKEIARVAQQQESAIEQALKAMSGISLATESTVASTRQVAAEARSLNELASTLEAAVRARPAGPGH
jgi:methyl-accepting chemotaxis protein